MTKLTDTDRMTRPSERELERDIKNISIETSRSQFVRQVAAVLDDDRDGVDAAPPQDTEPLGLVLRVSDETDASVADAWLAVDAAGGDPEPLADFTDTQT